jgi:hypothetical protein
LHAFTAFGLVDSFQKTEVQHRPKWDEGSAGNDVPLFPCLALKMFFGRRYARLVHHNFIEQQTATYHDPRGL